MKCIFPKYQFWPKTFNFLLSCRKLKKSEIAVSSENVHQPLPRKPFKYKCAHSSKHKIMKMATNSTTPWHSAHFCKILDNRWSGWVVTNIIHVPWICSQWVDSIRESKVSDLSFERNVFKICLQRHPGYGGVRGEILFQQLQIQNANPT